MAIYRVPFGSTDSDRRFVEIEKNAVFRMYQKYWL